MTTSKIVPRTPSVAYGGAEARQGLKKVDDFRRAIEGAGLRVPRQLTTAIKRFAKAIEAGVDLGEAAGEVDHEVQSIVADKMNLCRALDEDEQGVYEAKIARQWQASPDLGFTPQ